MRYYIYISLVAFLSVLCFNNAMGQSISPFGANRAQDTGKTKGQIVATAYANSNTALFATFNNTGHLVLAVPAGGSGSVDSVTISNDSLFYWGGGVSFFVGIVNSGGGVDTTGLSDRINYNLTRINSLSDSVGANRDSINIHRTAINGKEPVITPGTTADYWQGDKTWQPKSGLPISTATQAALDGKISYSDTPYIATQHYLEQNYFKNGGNVFGDEFKVGNLTWSQYIYGDGNGDFIFNNGAGPGWMFHFVQNNQDTVYTINTLNRHLFGTTTDRGYGFQVNKSVWLRDSVTIGNIPKRATPPDTTVGIVNGLLVAYPTPDGGDAIGLQGVLDNSNTATTGIYLSDYHNYDIISGTSKYASFLSRLSYTNPDSAAIPFLSNNKWTIEDTLPFPIYDIMSIPIFHVGDTGEVRYQGITSNINIDSTSTGEVKSAQMIASGGHFGYPGVRVRHYAAFAAHNPVIYDTCDYCFGMKIGGYDSPNYKNAAIMYLGGISNVVDGKWGIYMAPYITSNNYLGSSRTIMGLPTDSEIDSSATLQTTSITTTDLIKSTTDISSDLTDLSYPQKVYVDAADDLKVNIADTAAMLSPYLRAYGVTNDTNGLITLPSSGGINGGLKINGDLYLQTKDTQTTSGGTVRIGLSSNYTVTTGARIMNQVFGRFAPTTGTAVFSGYSTNITINQTGGANGITSSFWANPTLTAAADYRAFRASNSSGIAFYNEHAAARNIFLGKTQVGSATDLGSYVFQVSGNAMHTGEIYAPGISKAATKDSIVGWQNGQFFAIPKPAGGSGGGLLDSVYISNDSLYQCVGGTCTYVGMVNSGGGGSTAWGDITGTLSDQTDLQSALNAKQDTLGFTPENVANKATDFSTVNHTLYPSVEAVQEYVSTTSAPIGVIVNTQSGTTYTILSSDNGKIIEFTNSSAVTVTLPAGLGTTFTCIIRQNGTGDVTLDTSGTTVHNANSHTSTRAQYSAFAILPTGTANTFITQGDMD